jgi:hypothetical protein
MQRERFTKVVEEVLDSLPEEFRARIHNVAVLVEDLPPNQPSPRSGRRRLLRGYFEHCFGTSVEYCQVFLCAIHVLATCAAHPPATPRYPLVQLPQ